ncbi:nuclear pore complex protein Nup50 [Sitophilus oryzae]|uniref:Nuclear pore complex protein Nup50 n=1 Tax=Sitophilus oryzae TaxID=7048 RepID=A0A6J2YX01_SITOR|nr:nuclear pore complex protein Nup50 [Sitophilus oryzae]
MAGKRGASTELSQDNWDEEDDVEVQGTFQKATNDILKKRIIKTAKRRNPIRAEGDEKKSAFASFTGFTNKPLGGDFSFLSGTSKSDSSPKTNGIDSKASKEGGLFNLNPKGNSSSIFGAPTALGGSSNIFGSTANSTNPINPIVPSSSTISNKSEKFCSKLKGLNESVSKWISMKVTENPLVSLQPIFKDYEKYLDEIEKEDNKEANKPDKQTIPTFNFTPSPAKNNIAIPDSTTEKSTDKDSSTVPTFKFGIPTSSSAPKPTFGLGLGLTNNDSGTVKPNNDSTAIKPFPSLTTSNTSSIPTFSFGNPKSNDLPPPASTGFSFSNVNNQQEKSNQNKDNNEDDEENEPPKVEIQPVIEKDSLYTTRCKVFVKKGKEYSDRGIGNLFLKPIENSEKVQLIVRAETTLGNLLLNFILSKNVPTQRMGKQNVMLVAVPTPDVKPPPVPLLIKVKSAEEADQLLEVLEKYKK